ncbi:hypothetical protein STRDD10_00291 [Streptococcus sp. DD10]|uniref:hypothetical protein n=1 Tax=Streptococcus sp. DD10 TaxID=1777878 RepID=UPI000791BB1D|nr:hypothetical protein [Streptococcus sp. DD10]KXT76319.1 hypothetical protein STRDD10_00291 [Streptococcus sp. DD10]
MTAKKVSAARRRANDKWNKANPETTKYMQYKSKAKSFILCSKDDDVNQIEAWLDERKSNGQKKDGPIQ